MIDKATLLSYYKKREIQNEMIYHAEGREVAVHYNEFFGKRPDVLEFPTDILEFAKKGASSFHVSEEIWDNPLLLSSTMSKKDMDSLRIGWDLVLDIDCAFIEYSKISAYYVINALRREGIKNISCKFSGNKGFHIGIPFQSFPERINNEEVAKLFPEAPRKIAEYVKNIIKKPVARKILEMDNFSQIIDKTGFKREEITYAEKNEFGDEVLRLNVEPFLNIDTILISSRHLFRMPYSLHEKSGLASVPIDPKIILEFQREWADPKIVKVSKQKFLDREKAIKGEALQLFINAFDFDARKQQIKLKKEEVASKFTEKNLSERDFEDIQQEVPEELFPLCIKQIFEGLKDGRKRAVFILVNFLTSVGWPYGKIEQRLKEWNEKNDEPLKENYLVGQIRYHKQHKKKVLPPNCDNSMYYKDLGIKCDACKNKNVKNPVSYVRKQLWILQKRAEEEELKQQLEEKKKRKKEKKTEELKTENLEWGK